MSEQNPPDVPEEQLTIDNAPLERLVENAIYGVYDLAVCPNTFDILQFLGSAEAFRRARNAKHIHVCFVMGPGLQFRKLTHKDRVMSDELKMWRVRHILEPCARMLAHSSGVSFFYSRPDLGRFLRHVPKHLVFPLDYQVSAPTRYFLTTGAVHLWNQGFDVRGLTPSKAALDNVQTWIETQGITKPIVSMTLRQSSLEEGRDCQFDNWMRFSEVVRAHGMHPVAIPDTEVALKLGPKSYSTEIDWYPLAAIDVDLRAALYKKSLLNMSFSGGPAFINVYTPGNNYLIFTGFVSMPKAAPTKEELAAQMGFAWGEQFPWATPTQRLVWEPDHYENLVQEFEAMVPLLSEAASE